jgi:hypothetical protein
MRAPLRYDAVQSIQPGIDRREYSEFARGKLDVHDEAATCRVQILQNKNPNHLQQKRAASPE